MRNTINFNENWYFTKENQGVPSVLPTSWEKITLPHTWNAVDGQDGNGDYFRGACWYAKEFDAPVLLNGHRVFLEILAASLSSKVYINGAPVGHHEEGFSAFTIDITDYLLPNEKNLLAVCVDNSDCPDIYPQMADFTFYGGLYRGVNLITVPNTHFDLEFHAASGLTITTPEITENGAQICLTSYIKNASEEYTVRYLITDNSDCPVAELWRPSTDTNVTFFLPNAHLWQGVDDPYLYKCTASVVYRNEVVDEVSSRFGIRSFSVDSEKGFFLNGKPFMLRGVSRHQDRLYKGNALSREDHYEDAALIRELGANTIRLAHYQHSQDFYDACDEYGFIVWAEIPYISSQSDSPAAHENCRRQMQDLIYQNFNHPSICFWGLSNEITIAGEKPHLVENHKDLNALVKSLDSTRLTTMAHVTMLPTDSPLHGITDVESYNHYFGWYNGVYEDNDTWFDNFHANYPNICIGISEYGAEGVISYQTNQPTCGDYSEAYQAEYHEHMAKMISERPYLWSTHVWNMFDFGCAARNEGGTAGRNNKGLVTIDRKIKKDAFYLYKAYWSNEPFVHLCGRRYAQRNEETTTVKVYSNCSEVSLYINGEHFATQSGTPVFCFENVPLDGQFTSVTAKSGDFSDTLVLERVAEEPAIYTLPKEEDSDDVEVANWFSVTDSVSEDTVQEMQFPEGYFSVKDKVKDISKNKSALAILYASIDSAQIKTGGLSKKTMLKMAGNQTLEDAFGMLERMFPSANIPENTLFLLNNALNKIEK